MDYSVLIVQRRDTGEQTGTERADSATTTINAVDTEE